jgi:GT2 family glycosyltransferase
LSTEARPLLPDPLSRIGPHRRLPVDHDVSGPVGYVEGACFLVDRDVLRRSGAFDPAYFLYFEEMELGRRVAALGYEVHLCAEAAVQHAIGVSRQQLPLAGRPHLVSSTVRYLLRWQGRRAARTWVRIAKASWWLRERKGVLAPAERLAAVEAADRTLRESPEPFDPARVSTEQPATP